MSLREVAGKYLGIRGGFSVVRDVFGVEQTAGTQSLRSMLEDLVNGPLHIVVLGDSVGWGQGLRTEEKYASRLQRWLATELQPRHVNQPRIYAHSGANTPQDVNRERLEGEIPWSFPTTSTQVEIAVEELERDGVNPAYVDLVLVSTGINDVSIFRILEEDPTIGPDWVRKQTRERAVVHMEALLRKILEKFPGAKVVFTNYYQIISTESSLDVMVYALVALGIMVPAAIAGPILFSTAGLAVRNKLDKQSEAFNLEYTERALDQRPRPRQPL